MYCIHTGTVDYEKKQNIAFRTHLVSRVVLSVLNLMGTFCSQPWTFYARNPFTAAAVQAMIMVVHMEVCGVAQEKYRTVNTWLNTVAQYYSDLFMSAAEVDRIANAAVKLAQMGANPVDARRGARTLSFVGPQ
jgi:hypothetical protein